MVRPRRRVAGFLAHASLLLLREGLFQKSRLNLRRKGKIHRLIADLRQEIERRQKQLPKLIAQRDALSREITELQSLAAPEARRAAKPEAAPKKTRRRPQARNKVSLADALAGFLKGKAKVTISEASEGVMAGGYKSNARDFRGVVNNMLLKDKRFKKVGRGEFTLKA
jgi:chorismate mutase